ncbi:hypothetical protein TRVA0_024S00342 [Trichomonascus vanleenenianus]|uniref:uncharacterized protein n=1 Tax=Trichomonascus vanleenenianus TaxID=2268995 RepID=UPI003EC975D4
MTPILYTGDTLRLRADINNDLATTLVKVIGDWKVSDKGETLPAVVPPIEPLSDSPQYLNVTAKLFLPRGATPEQAAESVEGAIKTYQSLGRDYRIKHFILSVQGVNFADDEPNDGGLAILDDYIFTIWKAVTAKGAEYGDLIEEYGISELSTERLQSLLHTIDNTAQEVPIPVIDHINAIDCCALPPTLISISRERQIKLLAHHDPERMLPDNQISTITDVLGLQGNYGWDWIMRITSIVRDRQVLSGTEYFVSLSKR